eukprot:6107385-Alexandrium_andersonii.AAC.1
MRIHPCRAHCRVPNACGRGSRDTRLIMLPKTARRRIGQFWAGICRFRCCQALPVCGCKRLTALEHHIATV